VAAAMRLTESQLRELQAGGPIATMSRGKLAHPEDDLQRAVCQFWEAQYPATWQKTFHPPNGLASKSRTLAAIFSGLGMKPGVFDLICIARRGGFAGFALELKSPHGRVSQSQGVWAQLFHEEGWYFDVVHDIDAAMAAIRFYHQHRART
jgi:hypothetical protein